MAALAVLLTVTLSHHPHGLPWYLVLVVLAASVTAMVAAIALVSSVAEVPIAVVRRDRRRARIRRKDAEWRADAGQFVPNETRELGLVLLVPNHRWAALSPASDPWAGVLATVEVVRGEAVATVAGVPLERGQATAFLSRKLEPGRYRVRWSVVGIDKPIRTRLWIDEDGWPTASPWRQWRQRQHNRLRHYRGKDDAPDLFN